MPLERLGPYRIEKLLGRGGMGAVYAGLNEATGDRAAVKVLAAHLSDNADFRERFSGEVETLKKLKHPNIVQLLAYGEEGGHLFYVMELVDGRSLQDELQAGRRYDWREVARIGVEVCRALKHAHDSGVIHRDLKPAQPADRPPEPDQAHRLWHRQAVRRHANHRGRRRAGHGRLHVARAGGGQAGEQSQRSVQPGQRAVCAAGGASAVRRQVAGRGDSQPAVREAHARAPPGTRYARGV